jgi:hypothetical protein
MDANAHQLEQMHMANERVRFGSEVNMVLKHQADEVEVLEIPQGSFETNLCIICMDHMKDSIFAPCGHECVCKKCGDHFMHQATSKLCPLCRERVTSVIKVYR